MNPHGDFIWYELLTSDPDAAGRFYSDVIGWSAASARDTFGESAGAMDYRLFSAGQTAVAGFMKMPDGAPMPAGWLGYIGVHDVDAAVESIQHAGGSVHMPAMDVPGVGRMALVTDPQGVSFYVMRGASEEASTAFSPTEVGHCAWNELTTTDPAAAIDFYKSRFGWHQEGAMPMGEMGEYQFLQHAGVPIGAVMRQPPGQPTGWLFVFRVDDIDAAVSRLSEAGGTLFAGPHEVPGGEHVVVADDPQGARFGLVGPRTSGGAA